jgi:hypothetical protein
MQKKDLNYVAKLLYTGHYFETFHIIEVVCTILTYLHTTRYVTSYIRVDRYIPGTFLSLNQISVASGGIINPPIMFLPTINLFSCINTKYSILQIQILIVICVSG